jgi:hypothetical protein
VTKDKNDNPNEDEEEELEDEEEEDDEEEESSLDEQRMKKIINRMIKESGIDKTKLKGLSLDEQFDRLDFYMDNLPKPEKKKKIPRKNQPPVGMPTGEGGIGRKVRVGNKTFFHFRPDEWLKFKEEEKV